jgi:hypothetical protein
VLLKKAGEAVINLTVPLGTSAGRPSNNKEAKAAAAREASSKRMDTSINKWQASVTTHAIIRVAKGDGMLVAIMENQEKKIELEMTRDTVKKGKEDFMILTANTLNMDDKMKAAHMLFCNAILQEMGLRLALATATLN